MQERDTGPLAVETLEGGTFKRVILNRPKANVIDSEMTAALTEVFAASRAEPGLRVICFEGAGNHFSFGASVEEHLPDRVESMLKGFHALFRAMADSGLVLLAAVSGQCLGGGLELAAFCHRIFAAPGAMLGQPEIRLGVFAPVGSVILRERMGSGAAEDLCLTGRVVPAEEARANGLVDEVVDDPSAAALEYARAHLLGHSASSLRHAVRAVRNGMMRRFLEDVDEVERLYLEELMATTDAEEGIRAFLGKRKPDWKNE